MKDLLSLRIKLGDRQAFELLFRKYYARLCRFADKFLHEPEEACEVVQDVFVKLWEYKEDIDPEESIRAYLFKITQNRCINQLRKKKIVSRYIEVYKIVYSDNREISPSMSLIAKELNDIIAKTISELPLKCRTIFELNRFEGMKYKEIASNLNISIKTVEAQISKALQLLRMELKDYL